MARVLVIDDDRSVRILVEKGLEKSGHHVFAVANEAEGLDAIREFKPDVLLLDLVLKEGSGLTVFQNVQKLDSRLPVIFITGEAGSETTIEAMQMGALDYIAKPLDITILSELVEQAARTRQLMNTPVALGVNPAESGGDDAFLGRSPKMLEVFKIIGRVAKQKIPVLIRGESGTGKELVARAIYQHSDRFDRPFMEVNCAALPDTLLESELFGHEKGAFTGADQRRIGKFEQCDGGTIFLDEIGDMAPVVQAKVLRLLQEQRFERVGGNETIQTDVRIVTATNRQLEEMVEKGSFRSDLMYRLNGVTISLPPLRQRGADIKDLLQYFLSQAIQELGYPELQGLSEDALQALMDYEWPGNVRELRSVMRQAVINSTGTVIAESFLPPEIRGIQVEETESRNGADDGSSMNLAGFVSRRLKAGSTNLYAETLEIMERYLMAQVLQQTEGNQSQAAEVLGITRGKIRDRIAAFGINVNKTVSVDPE
ncbi:sigma-54-dependent transcriptional regulator [Thalassoglobus sp.]|uniref:sigma-54-dependent transcriptional regulator n=1 Tax=Thalassoglobus sp. TaxID=2795869 RepID=UPI003AA8D106